MKRVDLTSEEGLRRLEHVYRYALVGHCVNGVTHDANNMLGAIMAYAELLSVTEGISEESKAMLNEILESVRKANALLNAMTEIARKDHPDARIVDPSQILDRVMLLVQYDLKTARIKVEKNVEAGLPSILLDVPKTVRAVLCLVENAVAGAGQASERRVKFDIVRAGDAVEFVVWDSGPQPPEKDREWMFESLLTSHTEEHLGLGLALTRATARMQGGDLTYDPARGFVFRLPIRQE